MSDDAGPTAPRRPAPDPFYLFVAAELGIDPRQVIAGTMSVTSDESESTLAGTASRYRVTWQGIDYLTEETVDQLRAESRRGGGGLPTDLPLPRIDCHERPMLWKATRDDDESVSTTLHCRICHCVIRLDNEAAATLRRAAAAAGLSVIDFDFAAEHLDARAIPRAAMFPEP